MPYISYFETSKKHEYTFIIKAMSEAKKLIIVTGPTGIGKTDLSIGIAQTLGTEIISCDSRQIYRELTIGAASPSAEQLSAIRHHFVGQLSVTDYYSAGQFEIDALKLINKLFLKFNKILMVGGSGMYIDAIVRGIDDLPTIAPDLREWLTSRFLSEGIAPLRDELSWLDPEYYASSDIDNPKRILKALEVIAATGKSYSSLRTGQPKQRPFQIEMIGLNMNRDELYRRIDARVDAMVAAGLVDEARSLYQYRHLNALNTVGYKELFDHFDGLCSLDEAITLIKRNSRRYAKRQLTWFNRYPQMRWFDRNNEQQIYDHIKSL